MQTSSYTDKLVASPRWIERYCRTAQRVVGKRVLCPSLVPAGLVPTENLAALQPVYRKYLLDATGPDHWVFGAFVGRSAAWLRRYFQGFRVLAHARIHHQPALIVEMSQMAGIFAYHLAVVWSERGVLYAATMHSPPELLNDYKTELLTVARAFR